MNTCIHAQRTLDPLGLANRTSRISAALGVALLAAICLLARPCQGQLRIEAEAYSGVPFGVGRITLRPEGAIIRFKGLPRPGAGGTAIADLAKRLLDQGRKGGNPPTNLESAEMALSEKSGRALYPVFEKRDRPILREFVTVPTETTIFFLFQGDAPLDLTVFSPEPHGGRVAPRQDQAGYDRLLGAWWRDYSSAAAGNLSKEYSPLVEEYLTATLARRLHLELPKTPAGGESSLLNSELNLLMGTEAARQEWARTILSGDASEQAATEPLAEELPQPRPELLNPPVDVAIEPLALHVPVECMYVRFGSFPNFLWLRHRLEEWGGELRDVVSERGLSYALNERFQRQLGLREGALAELLGERVIADVAVIGADTFLREGAAIGMLFQAKNNAALAADLGQQRLTALKEAKDGKQEKLRIAAHQVSFMSTPGNSLHSYYVADGDFHLVTTSRAMVEWFLATGAGKHASLGASNDFRIARANMPLARNDTVFIYLSPAFFQNLFSPAYQIELGRRLHSVVEIELFRIAQLAARAEQKPGGSLEALVASGLLPAGFGQHPDGSRLELVGEELVDTLRGGRGTFLPVPDVEVSKVTRAEAAEYRRFSEYYAKEWGPMDPLVGAIQRQSLSNGKLERVVVDFEAAPLSQKHADMVAQWLGPPTDQRLAPVAGDVVAFEAVMRGGTFFSGGDHHLFGALRDADPALALDPRTALITRLFLPQLEGLQGYLGAWPNPGLLKMVGGASDIPPDAGGYSRLRTGLWRRQFDQFTLLSFHPEILAQVSGELHFEKAERPAQVWFRADDLANSKIAPLLNAYGYRQSRQISQGNTRFMNMLEEQLHVPAAECRKTGERLLDATFEAPLGGDYELREWPGGLKTWVATALADRTDATQPPADYQFPALNWLRGITVELRADQGLLAAHAEVIMPVETQRGLQLPGLSFGLPHAIGKQPNGKDSKPALKKPAPGDSSKSPIKREF
ncbi:MAG: hypothetical protein HY288_16650 [Planctomycetia bacterium]|nr:hypothetical protein [Planctomycetia bacterium]